MQNMQIIEADLGRADHQQATLDLVDAYSQDAMGDGKPLAPEVRANLVDGLRKHPTTIVFLAFNAQSPVGGGVRAVVGISRAMCVTPWRMARWGSVLDGGVGVARLANTVIKW